MESLKITLKWSKQTFPMTVKLGETGRSFKEEVQSLTNVPIDRQKLLCSKKKGSIHWKGSLTDDFVFEKPEDVKAVVVTLIGSAEAAIEAPKTVTRFVEDMTQEELQAVEGATEQAAMADAVGLISSIQLPAHHRNDGKQEMYEYNRLVTGLPQRYIEDLLKQRKQKEEQQGDDVLMMDQVAMTMGLELRRAYVNDIAVRPRDGALISALDDGHVQLWRHGQMEHDVIHDGGDGGIDSVVALSTPPGSRLSFATAGRGSYKLWSEDAEQLGTIRTPVPGVTPVSMVQVPLPHNDNLICLAASFKVVLQSNPSQFHLVPQNEEQRQRRAAAEAQEAARQELMAKMSSSIQVLYGSVDGTSPLQSHLLTNHNVQAAPITCVTTLVTKQNGLHKSHLVAGDQEGCIRVWEAQVEKQNGNDIVNFTPQSTFQLRSEEGIPISIVCLEALEVSDGHSARLAVSTAPMGRSRPPTAGAAHLSIPVSRAVHILDFNGEETRNLPTVSKSLVGHDKDSVICIRSLPNGGLLTGGGKLDATVQLWNASQLSTSNNNAMQVDGEEATNRLLKSSQTIGTLGYVFALEILPDRTQGSSLFAIAGARYNTVKIIL